MGNCGKRESVASPLASSTSVASRVSDVTSGVKQAKSTCRFQVGTKVICRVGGDWQVGVVVKLNYHEPGTMRPGQTVPYQVRLNDGRHCFVPADVDQLCHKLVEPWWASAFKNPASFYAEHNPSAECLGEEGVDKHVNAKDHEGNTALMEAARKSWPNAVSQLIKMKADINIAGSYSQRALHIAVPHCLDIVKMLVDAKADLNCQDEDPDFDSEFTSTTFGDRFEHRTALHYACVNGDAAVAKLLLEANANANIQDAQWKAPLHLAIDAQQNDCIDLMLSSGADTNLGNQASGMSNSPLMDAAAAGNVELVKKLIAAKANINQKGKQEMSALHLAARSRRAEVAAILLNARADMNHESRAGSALQLARKNGGADLLEAFGVKASVNVRNISDLDAAQKAALFLE